MTQFMPSKKSRALYDIRDSILYAQQFTEGLDLDRFIGDRKSFAAASRMLEIISEASRHLDRAVTERHPEIPWRSVRDVGNYIRHDYDNVAETFVWSVIANQLPLLLEATLAEIERAEAEPHSAPNPFSVPSE